MFSYVINNNIHFFGIVKLVKCNGMGTGMDSSDKFKLASNKSNYEILPQD